MRVVCTFCGLFLAIAIVNCSPIVKRDVEEPSPEDLNSVNEVSLVFYFFFKATYHQVYILSYIF